MLPRPAWTHAPWLASAALAILAGPASAVTLLAEVDPALSALSPAVGSPESLAGTLEFSVGTLPVAAPTTFDLLSVSLATSGGSSIVLDPDFPNPGLGVLSPGGAFLVPVLLLELDGADLSIPDVAGSVVFADGGASIATLAASFEIDSGGPEGSVTVTLQATVVPEPASAALASLGLAGLGLCGRAGARP